DDLERNVRSDGAVQLDGSVVAADRLDRLGERDGALVERRAAGLLHRDDEVVGGDGTEQLSALGDAGAHGDREPLDLGPDLGGVLDATDLTGVAGTLDALDLLLVALGPADGLALGQEVVAAVAVLDLD